MAMSTLRVMSRTPKQEVFRVNYLDFHDCRASREVVQDVFGGDCELRGLGTTTEEKEESGKRDITAYRKAEEDKDGHNFRE
jgi:hypothetical protein